MRLWTLHPRYLDRQGLLALWREALLAQAVLRGRTRGYRQHPQLQRFRAHPDPVAAIAAYLAAVRAEGVRRGYRFDARKIGRRKIRETIAETRGQLLYEWRHLKAKLGRRSPAALSACAEIRTPCPHPLFRIVPGLRRGWERPPPSSIVGPPTR